MRKRLSRLVGFLFYVGLVLIPSAAFGDNLHAIEVTPEFAIYRTGRPRNEAEMKQLCDLGIEEMVVLSGNAGDYEERPGAICSDRLKVAYDHKQLIKCPLTAAFLRDFDDWISRARENNRAIAFRCKCGCHRTGRLAAYYQIKYQGLTTEDALELMKQRGKWMWWPPLWNHLEAQVIALGNYARGEECQLRGKRARFCVKIDTTESTAGCEEAQSYEGFKE